MKWTKLDFKVIIWYEILSEIQIYRLRRSCRNSWRIQDQNDDWSSECRTPIDWTLKLGWGNLRLLYWMLKSYWIWGLHSWWWAGELVCVCFLCSVVLVESEVRLLLLWMKNEVKVNQLLLCGCILLRLKSMWILVYWNQVKQNKRSNARVKIIRWKYVKCGWKGIFELSLVIKIVQKVWSSNVGAFDIKNVKRCWWKSVLYV